jgi:hypothetical protein
MASQYMNRAFSPSGLRLVGILGFGKWEDHGPDSEIWSMADRFIDGARDYWATSPFPELMRLQDYLAFLEFAAANDAHVIVCAADPNAGELIGRAGYRCYEGSEFVISRETPPHLGCLAADPGDSRLLRGLAAYPTPLSYPDYVDRLRSKGIQVTGPEEGHALRAQDGWLLYQGYRLHGVYSRADLGSMWTANSGDHLRAELNRRLGHDLIKAGPHDDWEFRNDREVAGPLSGPQPPVIEFQPGTKLLNLRSADEMRTLSPVYDNNWSDLYPEPNEVSGDPR